MKEQILAKLKELEQVHGFKILFAIESGSREWGIASKDSDYDVRVVYYYPAQRYYDIAPYTEDFSYIEGLIDIQCMELRKFTKLMLNNNPTCSEWIQSQTTYVGEIPQMFKDFVAKDINLHNLAHHYMGLLRQNYHKYLENGKDTSIKRYLYAIKGWISAIYALHNQLPPIDFKMMISLSPGITFLQRASLLKILVIKLNSDKEKQDLGDQKEVKQWMCDFMNTEIPQKKKKMVDTLPYREVVMGIIEGAK